MNMLDLFEQMFKNTLNPCSHIDLNTQIANTIFKITTYCTQHTNNAKTLLTFFTILKNVFPINSFLFYIMYKLHNSYFVMFVNCVICLGGFLFILYYTFIFEHPEHVRTPRTVSKTQNMFEHLGHCLFWRRSAHWQRCARSCSGCSNPKTCSGCLTCSRYSNMSAFYFHSMCQ